MSATDANGPNGRDERGRFAPGCPGGPGSRLQRRQAKLRRSLVRAVGSDAVRAVAARLVALATDGDVNAAKLLLQYAVGKPGTVTAPLPNLDLDTATIGGIATALDQVLDGVRSGDIDHDQARLLLQVLDAKRGVLVEQELERRIIALEALQ
jgi:hypothetical protein